MVEGEEGQWTEKAINVCNLTSPGLEVSGQDANGSCWATAFVGSPSGYNVQEVLLVASKSRFPAASWEASGGAFV